MLRRIANLLLLGCALSAWGAAPATAQTSAPSFDLNVERVAGSDGDQVYRIASSGTVAATPAVVWRILTDYNHLADYLPNLNSTRIVSRDGASPVPMLLRRVEAPVRLSRREATH